MIETPTIKTALPNTENNQGNEMSCVFFHLRRKATLIMELVTRSTCI